jgi:selenocysteine lyase/cysteine desulfurase
MKHYLNNAGAGTMAQQTFEVIANYLKQEIEMGAYAAAQESKTLVNAFYENVKNCINADNVDEIAFMDSASRAWNFAIYGLNLQKGDSIITLSTEFGTNLITLFDYAKRKKVKINIVSCDSDGFFDINDIEKFLIDGAKVIAISQAVAHGSIVNPIAEIGKLVKKYNAVYIVDGCQAVGQMYVDVKSFNCHVYLTTGRKWLCGPRGTGFLYVKKSSPIYTTQLDLCSGDLKLTDTNEVKDVVIRQDARQFELWERSIANMLGFSFAIERFNRRDKKENFELLRKYADNIRQSIISNKKLKLIGNRRSESGIVGFYCVEPSNENELKLLLSNNGIGFSTMSYWDCPLHFPRNGTSLIFRLSPHYYTGNETVNKAIDVIMEFLTNGK